MSDHDELLPALRENLKRRPALQQAWEHAQTGIVYLLQARALQQLGDLKRAEVLARVAREVSAGSASIWAAAFSALEHGATLAEAEREAWCTARTLFRERLKADSERLRREQ